MNITKTLLVLERKNDWALKLVINNRRGKSTTELATFAKRPMVLCTMAGAVNSLNKWLLVDHLTLQATPEGIDTLKAVGIYEPEACDVEQS